jgi:UDP-N-acetylglucosamine--N-acetylmuramyl-(pentapeptide) pyrophosphoryl-undecaprenol N-acetylglucosamine transferase
MPKAWRARIVPAKGFPLETIEMSGVRGKGVTSFLLLPFRLLRAFFESVRIIRRVRPDILIGMGGYVTFPGAMMGVLLGKAFAAS